jgi:recombination protein RecA
VATPRKKRPKKKKAATKPKRSSGRIRKDPLKEYQEHIKKSGVGEVLKLADDDLLCQVGEFVSSQSLEFDKAIGKPGFPVGKITEIYGGEHAGKSTLTDHVMAETQKRDGVAFLIDTEENKDFQYSASIGVNVKKLQIIKPKATTIEDVVEAIEETLEFWAAYPDTLLCIVWDSVAATPTIRELEGTMKKVEPGLAARAMRLACRRLTAKIAQRRVVLMIVNQLYTKIGMTFGDPDVAYGGGGLRYHSTVRIKLTRGAQIKRGETEIIGSTVRANIKKSKMSNATGRKVDFALLHGVGIDNMWSIHKRLQQEKFIQVNGSWYSMNLGEGKTLKWQGGFEGLGRLCVEDPELFERLVGIFQSLP